MGPMGRPWLGVLHSAMVRELLEPEHVQALIPRRCWVSKSGGKEAGAYTRSDFSSLELFCPPRDPT
jgi:hypothetical protein